MKFLSRKKLAELRTLHQRKFREKLHLSFVEGETAVREILQGNARIKYLLFNEIKCENLNEKFADLLNDEIEVFVLPQEEFNEICDTVSSQGVLAVVEFPEFLQLNEISEYKEILVLNGVQDPGNVGTLIRSASAFEVELIVALTGTAEIMNPKVLRASAGLLWSMKFARNVGAREFAELARENFFNVFAADMNGDDFYKCMYKKPWMLILGNEGAGISDEFKNANDEHFKHVKIIHEKNVESLNVGVAGSVILSWIYNQGLSD